MRKVSHIDVIGSLLYRTECALRLDNDFICRLKHLYPFSSNIFDSNGNFSMWHYPGTKNEIENALNNMSFVTNRWQYPAMLDIQPNRQVFGGDFMEVVYDLAIASWVSKDWSTEERDRYLFATLLRPIYEEFMRQIARCEYLVIESWDDMRHDYWENFATGGEQGVILESYGNYISAIELHDLNLKISNNLCQTDIDRIISESDAVGSKLK